MVVGVGIDVVEVARIKEAMNNPRFIRRILTPAERESCTTPERVAGRWAAKEAIAKAVGTHLRWQDVEVVTDPGGKPSARVADARLSDPSVHRLHLSISHERGLAIAMAVFELTVEQ